MLVNTDATWAKHTAKAILLIRILVGWVFLSEGIQKFLFPPIPSESDALWKSAFAAEDCSGSRLR